MPRIDLPVVRQSDLAARASTVMARLQGVAVPNVGEVVAWVRDGAHAAATAVAIGSDWLAGAQERAVSAAKTRRAR